ncbi:MAG: YhbY family RNA-binding protein [Clostridia bacterium]|jgi:RNA-binding protein|nr:YhbY family RNA-binding protein [Clostridia bacterium]
MNSRQRAYLIKLSHELTPIFQIGKEGVSPALRDGVAEALAKREIVKINVLKNCFEDPKDLGILLSERTTSTLVKVIGRKIVLYKPAKEPKIQLPK